MAKKAVQKKKRNPNDATFRNVRALKARVFRNELSMDEWAKDIVRLAHRIAALERLR